MMAMFLWLLHSSDDVQPTVFLLPSAGCRRQQPLSAEC